MWVTRLRKLGAICISLTLAWWAHGETDRVLILHTNDIHGHFHAGADQAGGFSYLSGYVKAVRAERPDALLLDAGDVCNKGDMLGGRTKGFALYDAMKCVGYDAGAPGNHDLSFGPAHLNACQERGGFPILCANLDDKKECPGVGSSIVLDVDGVKVGLIGLTVRCRDDMRSPTEMTEQIEEEAKRLDVEAQLIVVVAHFSSSDAKRISPEAHSVDVFVTGHSHEVLQEPVVVPQTGALIVQAGSFADYVGRLDLTLDMASEDIVAYEGGLVCLEPENTPCDRALQDWIHDQEERICPEADEVLGCAEKEMARLDLAQFVADVEREKMGADVALCRLRTFAAALPAGPFTGDDLYKTMRVAEVELVVVPMLGHEILAYLDRAGDEKGALQWSGFEACFDYRKPVGMRLVKTDLEMETTYRTCVPLNEWEEGIRRGVARLEKLGREDLQDTSLTVSELLFENVDRLAPPPTTP